MNDETHDKELGIFTKYYKPENYSRFIIDENSENTYTLIYMMKRDNATYIGNKYIKYGDSITDDNIEKMSNDFLYWFEGESNDFKIMFKYYGIDNYQKRNQKLFNEVKRDAISYYKTTYNIALQPAKHNEDIFTNYAKEVKFKKEMIKMYLDDTSLIELKYKFIELLKRIRDNKEIAKEILSRNRLSITTDNSPLVQNYSDSYLLIIFKDIFMDLLEQDNLNYEINKLNKYINCTNLTTFRKWKKYPFSIDGETNLYMSIKYKRCNEDTNNLIYTLRRKINSRFFTKAPEMTK